MQHHRSPVRCFVLAAMLFACNPASAQDVTKWHTLELDFAGPATSETATTNPFTDYRLNVTFTHPATNTTYTVPGFYDGDGRGGGTGNTWRVRFSPDQVGQWQYTASFRTGTNVAVELGPSAGTATGFDGQAGAFTVGALDTNAPGFLSQGRLEYVGGHYLKFRDGGYFIKGGADSPENLLGYSGFDNTPNYNHQFAPHAGDWNLGDPDWTNEASNGVGSTRTGRNLVGALNYLGEQRVNSVYFLPMNIGGDGKDTYPYQSPINVNGSASNDNTRFDISKLTQWETALAHAQAQGVNLNIVLNEAETPNKQELDNATLGVERKLFYREMVARFGHHNALQWNISEEYNRSRNTPGELSPDSVKSFAQYLQDVDPYDHPISVHNGNYGNWPTGTAFPGQHTDLPGPGQRAEWEPFFGDARFSLTSYQNYNEQGIGDEVEYLRQRSIDAGRPIAIMVDEPESLDALSADNVRKHMIWDIYLSGGGVEWFVRQQDQSLEDFRQFETVWQQTWYARKFLEENTRFWEMQPSDDLLVGEDTDFGGGEVFAIEGEQYAIYLPDGSNDDNNGGPPTLDLSDYTGASFLLRWYDPRIGVFVGGAVELAGGGLASLGLTPDGFQATTDWAALVTLRLPGDTDADGDIDDSDLGTAFSNYTGPLAPGIGGQSTADGDTDGDGDVDDSDLGTAFSNYTGPLGPIAGDNVPEPASIVLMFVAGGVMPRRSRARCARRSPRDQFPEALDQPAPGEPGHGQ
ncbi:MAG: DUF5060 domain-containing protein [Phycisphaeraceae bacterium]